MLAIKRLNLINSNFLLKRLSSTQNRSYEEIRIPVPWGHIAGKWWGPQNKRPIVGIHGWQDNCGTFDTLAPHLVPHIGLLAFDFPGHGMSSHLPPGVFYHSMDYVIALRRIVKYFDWPKVSLLGHSMGGITGYLYSVLYPDTIDFLICLDAFRPIPFDVEDIDLMAGTIKYFIKYDQLNRSKNEPPSYTFDALEQNLHESTGKAISLESSKYILQRSTAPSTRAVDQFYLTRDARLKPLFLALHSEEFVTESAYKLTCPTCITRSTDRNHPFDHKFGSEYLLDVIKKRNENFEYHHVEGTHHVHLNNPERLSGLINAFIEKYDVEDRSVGGFKRECTS